MLRSHAPPDAFALRGATLAEGDIMGIESRVGIAALWLFLFGSVIGAEREWCLRPPLPANVRLLHNIEESIQRIYAGSPSFRAQCARIAEADNLRVSVRINPAMPSRCRAFTVVQRRGTQIRADVHLPPSANHAELLAHEFEHILEQIEGLDLRRLVRVKASGVFEVDRAMYETVRAQAAGRVVAGEVRRRADVPAD
jgi:hypothetical protein